MNTRKTDLRVFELAEVFFTTVEFRRGPEVPQPVNVQFNVQLAIRDAEELGTHQVQVKLETLQDQPIAMVLELVGLFESAKDQPPPSAVEVRRFVSERGLFMLWPNIVQMAQLITGQMGMNPVKLPTPSHFPVFAEESG